MKKGLTSFDLRVIGVVTMTIDHLGAFVFPQAFWMRVVGRMAFPLFAFLCAEAYRHTHDKLVYAARLLILGSWMHLVMLAIDSGTEGNVFIALAVSFIVLWSIEHGAWGVGLMFLIFGLLMRMDYGIYAVILVLLFYYGRGDWLGTTLGWVLDNFLIVTYFRSHWIQHLSLMALVPLWYYNGQPGEKRFKYFFYLYYPLHVILLKLIGQAL